MSSVHARQQSNDGVIKWDGFLANSIFADVDRREYVRMLQEISAFSHQFKSNSNNSTRLRINTYECIAEALKASAVWSRWTSVNNNHRLAKIASLPSLVPDPAKCMPFKVVRDPNRPLFFSGADDCLYGKNRVPKGGVFLPVRNTLHVVDSTLGFHLEGVCTLVCRDEALATYPI
jgi:hypothetical protein